VKNRPEKLSMAFIGAGNVAWHLGHEFIRNGAMVKQVISHTVSSAKNLATALGASYSDNTSDLMPDVEICIISISDDILGEVIKNTRFGSSLVLHTAGSIPLEVFKGYAKNYGVFYPFQTITKGRELNWKEIPILIEANSNENLSRIRELGDLISRCILEIDSITRINLHLAAVFASNFSNHMYVLAEKLMIEQGLGFDIIMPLISETAAKVMKMKPVKAQTGPAIRGSRNIMDKHLQMLDNHPEMKEIYRLISENIRKMNKE
jgi:predicted short-subunit dehydrogenase-like oxidoreductase (DUF2520 family)